MTVTVKQINTRKVQESSRHFATGSHDITMYTEPNRMFISQMKKYGKVLCHDDCTKVRSVILIKNNAIDATLLPQFTTPDVCTVLIEKENIILISAYHDINLDAWWDTLDDAITYAANKSYRVLLGSDTNAHSLLWESDLPNERGEVIEEACAFLFLHVCNNGNKPTYFSDAGNSTIVDVTFASDPDMVTNWRVSDEVTFSDHRCIEYELDGVEAGIETTKRSLAGVDWSNIARELKSAIPSPVPFMWSPALLDEAVTHFTTTLKLILDAHAPLKPFTWKSSPWWTPELTKLKRDCKLAALVKRRCNSAENKKAFSSKMRAFQRSVRKTRFESWKKFISDIDSVHATAKCNRILKRLQQPTKEIGLIKYPNGALAETKQESLEVIMAEHFPDSVPATAEHCMPSDDVRLVPLNDYSWLTIDRLRAGVKSLKCGKSPGPDEVRAELLKAMDTELLEYLLILMTASLTLGYVPLEWRSVKCIYLSKQGKSDFCETGAWRPITLASAALKLTEKLCLWHLEESALSKNPLHKHQYGAVAGRSADMAASNVVNKIEKAMMNDQWCIAVFLDVKGAYNNLKFSSITEAMTARGFHSDIVGWYSNFLHNRIVTSQIGQSSASIIPRRGTPQGGVCSSLAYNLPMDAVLRMEANTGVTSFGYVDDSALVAVGADPGTLFNLLNSAIKRATEWATSVGLTLCTKKSQYVVFTYRDNKKPINVTTGLPYALKMYGNNLPQVEAAKYLGIWLDQELTFVTHVNKRITACRLALLRTRSIVAKKWSPKPEFLRWLYNSCVVSIMSYGCAIWIKALDNPSIQTKLQKLQRMGLTSIAPTKRGTPTASLEIIYDIPPLPLLLEERASNTYLRLGTVCNDVWTASSQPQRKRRRMAKNPRPPQVRRGHLAHIRRNLPKVAIDDVMTPVPNFDQNYTVSVDESIPYCRDGVCVYTDGSKSGEPTGSGMYIEFYTKPGELDQHYPFISMSERLPPCSVYQSELRAIQAASEFLLATNTANKRIHFHSDSLSSLQAIQGNRLTSRTVLDTVMLLKALGRNNTVSLQKVRSHQPKNSPLYCPGNDYADGAARYGCKIDPNSKGTFYISRTEVKNDIRERRDRQWLTQWRRLPGHRQSKEFIQGPDPKIWRLIRKLPAKKLTGFIRFVTGFGNLRRHKVVLTKRKRRHSADKDADAVCRLCGTGEETGFHLICICPRLMHRRHDYFSDGQRLCYQLDQPPPISIKLLDFIQCPILQSLEDDHDTPRKKRKTDN